MKLTAKIEQDKMVVICAAESEYEEKLLGALINGESGMTATPVIKRGNYHFTHEKATVIGVELRKTAAHKR